MVNLKELSDSEKIENGCYETRLIIEVLGKPKEHVEKTRNDLLEQIKSDKEVLVVEEFIAEPKDEGEGMFSSFVELNVWFSSIIKLMQFVIVYLPSHIEILRPDQMIFKTQDLGHILADLTNNLHAVNKVYQETTIENEGLKKTLGFMMKNSILISLTRKKMNIDELSKYVGLTKESLKPALETLIKEKRIKESNGVYSLQK